MGKAKAAILAEPKGLNVATVTELRRKLREAKVSADRALPSPRAAKGTPVEPIAEKFVGPTALVASYDDVVAPAKLLAEFMKDRESFSIRTAVIGDGWSTRRASRPWRSCLGSRSSAARSPR